MNVNRIEIEGLPALVVEMTEEEALDLEVVDLIGGMTEEEEIASWIEEIEDMEVHQDSMIEEGKLRFISDHLFVY